MIPRKVPRTQDCSVNDKDYISSLPEEIICCILSCLPTTDAVKTSVLSKEWEKKWTSICNIEITDKRRKEGRRKESKESGVAFINFMRSITRATNVRNLRIRLLMNYKVSETRSWISDILKNQIETLHVETPARSSTQLILRGSLLKTPSLEQLVLKGPNFRVPNNLCFRSLRSLDLDHVCLSNENSRSDTLVLNFPALKTFKISCCRWLVKVVEIYAPTLTTFSCDNNNYFGELANHTINIHGDKLAEFASTGGKLEDIFVTGSKVVSAKFSNTFEEDEPLGGGLRIQRLLKEFACTLDYLMLTSSVAKAISNKGVSLTCFAKLRRLFLDCFCDGYTQVLLDVLHAMPCLKFLKLRVGYRDDFDYATLDYMPSCIASSLEKIEFVMFLSNSVALLLLAKCLMNTASSLKEFYVHHYNKELEDNFVEKISAYPTCSGHVKIVGSYFHV